MYTPDEIFCPSSLVVPSEPATHDTACLYNHVETTVTWSIRRSNHHLRVHCLFENNSQQNTAPSALCELYSPPGTTPSDFQLLAKFSQLLVPVSWWCSGSASDS